MSYLLSVLAVLLSSAAPLFAQVAVNPDGRFLEIEGPLARLFSDSSRRTEVFEQLAQISKKRTKVLARIDSVLNRTGLRRSPAVPIEYHSSYDADLKFDVETIYVYTDDGQVCKLKTIPNIFVGVADLYPEGLTIKCLEPQ